LYMTQIGDLDNSTPLTSDEFACEIRTILKL